MRPATIRRSVALSRQLVEQVQAAAPPAIRQNVNRIVTVALQEFLAKRRQELFDDQMARMAQDPAIRGEGAHIAAEFAPADDDGLPPLDPPGTRPRRKAR